MTPLSSFTSPGSYWQASRAPRYSLLFALPLLVFYQLLATLLSTGPRSLRNGADVILQSLFAAAAGTWGAPLFMACLIAVGLWLVVRDMHAHGSRLSGGVFCTMLGESVVLALAFGIVVGGITSGLMGLLHTLALAPGQDLDGWTRLMVSLGAGIYEELLFRVLLVTLLAAAARTLLGWGPVPAGVAASILGAAIFSAFHYVGAYGDRFQLYSFVFRMIAGLFFSALYLVRGFGITAWTHALYDVLLLVIPHSPP
ncbi:MAG TPA: CPBP family glutamic-type intramembrane protease [Gemmatimonadales bacterium]|nr:CPBP family glutamic-type intramembrane protease [Gemmatimonadales bacterium]